MRRDIQLCPGRDGRLYKGWDEAVMAVCIWHSGIRRVSWKMLL